MNNINSRNNKKIKELALLKKSIKRKELKDFLIDGKREIQAAIDSKVEITEFFCCKDFIKDGDDFFNSLDKNKIILVSKPVFEKISYKKNPDGFLALAEYKDFNFNDIRIKDKMTVAILESVEKPGNLGAIIRTAYAAGITNIILNDNNTDIFNPNIIRSSEGLVFKMNIIIASKENSYLWLKENNFDIYTTNTKISSRYTDIEYKSKNCFVFGSEAEGVSDYWIEKSDKNIKIPMPHKIDSLNVSVSFAIIVFELLRQQDFKV